MCLSCRRITPTASVFETLDPARDPRCDECGGLLKPNTVSFGQNLDPDALDRARELSSTCDLMLAVGSTLSVQPAAGFPAIAVQSGANLVILTLSETPLDDLAEVVVNQRIGDVVRRLEG